MIRVAAPLLLIAVAACSTTSTVYQPLPPVANDAHAYAYAFGNNGGDDLEGIAKLDRLIHGRLLMAGLVETTNLSAWGSTEGLMEKHADEIVAGVSP